MAFGEDGWMEEEERRRQEKLAKYEGSLKLLLEASMASKGGEITLEALRENVLKASVTEAAEEKDPAEDSAYRILLPNVQIFKEIMVELLKGREIDMEVLREERRNYIGEVSGGFQLNEMLLNLADTYDMRIGKVEAYRIEDGRTVRFEHVPDETGRRKTICCSNVLIRVTA